MSEQSKIDAERAAFEVWMHTYDFPPSLEGEIFNDERYPDADCFGQFVYDDLATQRCWSAWQARASHPVGVPDGWALVPDGPTQAQNDAARAVLADGSVPLTKIYRAMVSAAPAAPTVKAEQVQAIPQEWWQIIHDTLRNYRLTTLVDQDGDGYPLIDAMTADGQPVSDGINECDYLTDAIWNALPTQAPSLPAAGSAVPALESWVAFADALGLELRMSDALWENARNLYYQLRAALYAQQSAPAYGSYTTRPAEAVAGIALRQLGDESRWVEIRDLNAHAFPGIGPHDYYPVGTVLRMPAEQQSAPERVSVDRALIERFAHGRSSFEDIRLLQEFLASHGRGEA